MKIFKSIMITWLMFSQFLSMYGQDVVEYNHPHYYLDGDYWVQGLVNYEFDEHLKSCYLEGFHQDLSLYAFYVEGDTIIEQKEYKCVHAQKWFYEGESAFNGQSGRLEEIGRFPNILFMREDLDGKQWRRLNGLDDEALLFDFCHPFKVGQLVKFCRHSFLKEHSTYNVLKTSRSSCQSDRPNGAEIWKSDDDAPRGYMYYDMEVREIKDFKMPNGEEVSIANGHIAFGWGDIKVGDLWHQFLPDEESLEGRFLFRVHQGQIVIENKANIQSMQRAVGINIYSLVNDFLKSEILETRIVLPSSPNPWCSLYGCCLTTPPSRPGLYIKDGRKVLIK